MKKAIDAMCASVKIEKAGSLSRINVRETGPFLAGSVPYT